jgi:hypothetical protein
MTLTEQQLRDWERDCNAGSPTNEEIQMVQLERIAIALERIAGFLDHIKLPRMWTK